MAAGRAMRCSVVVAVSFAAAAVLPATATAAPVGHTVVGKLVRAYVEHRDRRDADAEQDFGFPLTWVDPANGPAVRVPTLLLAGAAVGATVSVTTGAPVTDSAAVDDHLAPAQQVLAASVVAPAPSAPTTAPPTAAATPAVTDTVTAVLVAPAGSTADATSLDTVEAQVSGPVARFWAAQSGGAIHVGLGADLNRTWITTSADCSDPLALWNEVAGDVGFTPAPGQHLMLYVPSTDTQCSYGLAQVGASLHAGGYLYVQDTTTSVIAHELGHNFGLLHSGTEECQGEVEVGACSVQEYGDLYDVMGGSWSQVGSLNAVQAARLGLLPGAQVHAVTATDPAATYGLVPLAGTSGTRALRLTAPDGREYYLEYRTATGQDSWLGSSSTSWTGTRPGVLLRRAEQSDPADSSLLLDGTPSSGTGYANDTDDVLPVGTAVPVAGGRFFVTVVSQTSSGASVAVVPGTGSWTTASNQSPVGSWDAASGAAGSVSVSGWAFDPDSPTGATQVHVYVDGVGTAVVADGSRPDVGAAYPQAGPAHGFGASVPATVGDHTVCLYAIDAQLAGTHTDLGCRTVSVVDALPVGSWDTASGSGGSVSVSGWAFDADSPTVTSRVDVYVDGVGTALVADGSRPDVGAAYPQAGPAHGFTWSTPAASGSHTVCVYAIDVELPGMHTGLGCRAVTVGAALPVASWDMLQVSGTTLQVSGWAFDPDSPTVASQVHVYVDGVGTALVADGSRPDVGAAYPQAGPAHGFTWSTIVAPGTRTVCLYAIDAQQPDRNLGLGCRTATAATAP